MKTASKLAIAAFVGACALRVYVNKHPASIARFTPRNLPDYVFWHYAEAFDSVLLMAAIVWVVASFYEERPQS